MREADTSHQEEGSTNGEPPPRRPCCRGWRNQKGLPCPKWLVLGKAGLGSWISSHLWLCTLILTPWNMPSRSPAAAGSVLLGPEVTRGGRPFSVCIGLFFFKYPTFFWFRCPFCALFLHRLSVASLKALVLKLTTDPSLAEFGEVNIWTSLGDPRTHQEGASLLARWGTWDFLVN